MLKDKLKRRPDLGPQIMVQKMARRLSLYVQLVSFLPSVGEALRPGEEASKLKK